MDPIDRIRAFNRQYTQLIGLLSRTYLGSALSLSETRVLYELSLGSGQPARTLARMLDLDEGYLSRVLKGFEARGWLIRAPAASDARRRDLALTAEGRAVLADLERRARDDLAARLAPLPAPAHAAAADALETALSRLTPLSADAVTLRDIAPGDAGWLIQRHAEYYSENYGFDASFEPLVAQILTDFLNVRDRATERAFIAADGARRLGSIFCVQSGTPGVAKLRLFFLEPDARGIGLGQRLLDACLGFARGAGYRQMTLWTHESHRAACAIYAKAGFTLTASKPVHSFGQDLVEQSFEIAL